MSGIEVNKSRLTGGHFAVLLAAFLGWMFDGFELGLFPIVARPALQSMFTDGGATTLETFVSFWTGWGIASGLLGMALGGLVFGWLGDKFGRVRAMALSILTYSFCTGLGYFATEPWHFSAFRFLSGLGMGGEWSLGVALVMESWPDKLRPLMAGIIGAAANFGFLLIGYIGRQIPISPDSWRWVWLVGVIPAVVVFFIFLVVPESERWKASQSHGPNAPLRDVFSRKQLRYTILGIVFASIALIGTWGTVQWIPVWVDQMVGAVDKSAKGSIAMYSAMGAIFGCLAGPLMGGRIGRRPAFFALCLASLVVCGYLYRADLEYGPTFKAVVFLAGFFTAAFYGWFPLFLPELFPTRMRATGQGVCFNMGRVFAAAGALLGGALVQQFDGSYARMGAIISLVYVFGMVLIWFAPETKGQPLPD